MRRILPARTTAVSDTPPEAGAPPHPERPAAASSPPNHSTLRRRRRPAARLALAVVAIAALGTACSFPDSPYNPFDFTSGTAGTSGSSAPAATAASAPSGSPEAAIREVFGPLGVADKAVQVAICESGLNPAADSGTYKGLFQLGPHLAGTVAFYGGNWFDPLTNAQVARDLYLGSGWASWPVCGSR
jgi:hypothetical protein